MKINYNGTHIFVDGASYTNGEVAENEELKKHILIGMTNEYRKKVFEFFRAIQQPVGEFAISVDSLIVPITCTIMIHPTLEEVKPCKE